MKKKNQSRTKINKQDPDRKLKNPVTKNQDFHGFPLPISDQTNRRTQNTRNHSSECPLLL